MIREQEPQRPKVFNGRYQHPWHDGWAARLPNKFDTVFPTHAEAMQCADQRGPKGNLMDIGDDNQTPGIKVEVVEQTLNPDGTITVTGKVGEEYEALMGRGILSDFSILGEEDAK